jgi:hypothetical protein
MSIEQYYLDFRSFKDDFIMACPIDQKYECYKVWAQWLIRNLSQNPVNYHIIPDKESIGHDTDIINHIHEKGGHDSDIGFFYDRIKSKCGLLYDQYNTSKFIQFHNSSQRVVMSKMILHETKTFLGKKTHIYRLGAIYVKYEEPIHHKLLRRYQGTPDQLPFYLFEMGFNYYMLDGHSFQWCVPPKAIGCLGKGLDMQTELFASPINAILPRFYSLFFVDKVFGAIDNFFNLKPDDMLNGTYEINPPFVDQIFIDSSKIVIDHLQRAHDLLLIYIMPAWLDSIGYQILKESQFLVDEIILLEGQHYYSEGAKSKLVSASFRTHVMILGTEPAKARWTEPIKSSFITNFKHF